MSGREWLIAGGCLSALASLIHLACIFGGPDWYRFFGAGEGIARAAERGFWTPHLFAIGIAAVLATGAYYAFAGAGLVPRPPLLRTGLVTMTAVYLLRGMVVLAPSALARPDLSRAFLLWSSLIVLGYGVVHAVGIWQAWSNLSGEDVS